MDVAQLLRNEVSLWRLALFLGPTEDIQGGNSQATKIFEHFGIVPSRNGVFPVCPGCGGELGSVADRQRYGWRFKCVNGHRFTPTVNTLLENSRLNDMGRAKIVLIAYMWLNQFSIKVCEREVHVTHDTCVAWFSYFRDVARKIAWHDFQQIGGPHDVVEVNERDVYKKKNNAGRFLLGQRRDVWVFGAISRVTRKRFGVLVPDRTQDTLMEIMQQYIDSDSFICSTECRSYRRVGQVFAGHRAVDHRTNFLFPPKDEDPLWVPAGRFSSECLDHIFIGPAPGPGLMEPFRVHTQTGERSWLDLKTTLKKHYQQDLTEQYIGEWMYRWNILDDINGQTAKLERFLRDIARAYPGLGRRKMEANLEECQCHECEP